MHKIIILIALFLVPVVAFSNGGDQRVVENQYFINLSRAPFTPRVGVPTSFLASFVDIQKNKLIAEDLIVKVRIAKQNGAGGKREFIFEQDNITVKGGILELKYTFENFGLHEIFFDFALASNPQKVYGVPDFLIDVQPEKSLDTRVLFLSILISGVAGFVIGWLVKNKK